jgi:potassium efflux system protein
VPVTAERRVHGSASAFDEHSRLALRPSHETDRTQDESHPYRKSSIVDGMRIRFDDARMHVFLRIALCFVLIAATLPSFAQAPDSVKTFDAANQQLADVRKQLAASDDNAEPLTDARLNELRDTAASVTAQADALTDDRSPRLAAIDARLGELGAVPLKGAAPEASDITAQRADLDKQRSTLDAEIKRAKLLAIDARQLTDEIAEARRANFQAKLSQRTASPLTPTFWRDVAANLSRDSSRLDALRAGVTSAVRDSFSADNRVFAIGGVCISLLLIVVGRWWAERALMRTTANRVPQGRLRRSALAFAIVVVSTLFFGGGAQLMVVALDWHGAFSDAENTFARAVVSAVFFGSFVAGLGRALLSAARPSWRLPSIPDDIAERLRLFPMLLGCAIAFSILQQKINTLVSASLSATISGSLIVALIYAVLIGWGLTRIAGAEPDGSAERTRDNAKGAEKDGESRQRSAWIGFCVAAMWVGVIGTVVAALTGYVALAQQIARQMVGLGIVAATFYLLVHLIEDVCAAIMSTRAGWLQHTLGLEPRSLEQFEVLCSGIFRVCALVLALATVFSPYGSGPADLLARIAQAGAGLKIGQIEVTPGALFGAFAVLVLGIAAVRALKNWLFNRYLPTTRLDPGMRISVTTLLGYVGGVVVFAFALSALGFSLERITWVASALSVGIGFGLQAIVQNFVSGLILLVERPVKVGDWVVLGDAEGDIRRINVRATEIQMSDRSTVIVPNSELITKSVRNVTLANAEGRVRIRLPIPIDTDAARVREILREAFSAHHGVLTTPTPSVLLDGIEGGSLIFIAIAYIANPRQSGSVRSELLFDIIARLRAERIALSSPQDIKLLRPAASTAAPIDVPVA